MATNTSARTIAVITLNTSKCAVALKRDLLSIPVPTYWLYGYQKSFILKPGLTVTRR